MNLGTTDKLNTTHYQERVLREVGRVLRTYCYDNHKKWGEFINKTETFLNIAYHETIGVTPYQMMFSKPPPREITNIIQFPEGPAARRRAQPYPCI